jgi:hypothetical protein
VESWTTISSSRPAAIVCCRVEAPPTETSWSSAASTASAIATSIPPVTKWKLLPF